MPLIDTHAHLDSFLRRGELPAVLERARAAEVAAVVTVGTAPDDWTLYRDLASEHPGVIHFTVGLHPCSVDEKWASALADLEAFWVTGANGSRPVALGECGLDRFHLPKDPAEAERILGWQREAFQVQLQLARRMGCPVIVHSRGAFAECVELIDASGMDWTRVVFHCFAEGPAEISALMERGGFGSFTGILTYKSAAGVREAAKVQGLDRFMVETDAPWLAPVPHRGETNEPGHVRLTAEFAAREVFQVPLEQVAEASTAMAQEFFGIRLGD